MTWWKDIDITLEKKHNGDINDFKDEYAIMESLRNIFKTIQGSRRRLPEFALNLYELLFEPIDEITAREIGEVLYDAINRWEPRVIIEDLLVQSNQDKYYYDITLTFRIRSQKRAESYKIKETIQAW